MGVALFFEFFYYTIGLQYTTVAKTSFIIASYIILLPVVYFIIRKKLISRGDILCSILCMGGLCLILFDGASGLNRGDFFQWALCCLLCGAYRIFRTVCKGI